MSKKLLLWGAALFLVHNEHIMNTTRESYEYRQKTMDRSTANGMTAFGKRTANVVKSAAKMS